MNFPFLRRLLVRVALPLWFIFCVLDVPVFGQDQVSGDSQSLARNTPLTQDFLTAIDASASAALDWQAASSNASTNSGTGQNQTPGPANSGEPLPNPQPKRILGIMPNFRAVSAGTRPPPPTPKQSFIIATRNSFDYSSFIFVGVTSLLAEGTNAHAQLGKGVAGFGRYYWRGLADKTDGNYWVIFVLPTLFHQDERYYALGKGGFWKRAVYSSTRVLITPSYQGHSSFNVSELLGRAIAQAISIEYYPSQTRTAGGIASKYGYAIGRDVLTNVFREFWPDIAVHVLHRRP